jgi:hypothetical protein
MGELGLFTAILAVAWSVDEPEPDNFRPPTSAGTP